MFPVYNLQQFAKNISNKISKKLIIPIISTQEHNL